MALIDDYDLTQDAAFIKRCEMAVVSTALAVQAEAASTANHSARSAYSLKVLANPIGYTQLMSPAMTVDGSLISTSTDAQLKSRASAIFNAYAVQG